MTLSVGHSWGDDFAGYIMQTQSILEGKTDEFVSRNTFTVENSILGLGPIAYPWGFPLLLVPVYSIWGFNLIALKLVNPFFFLLFLISSYLLLKNRLKPIETLFIVSILAFHPALLVAHDSILSDIPFLFVFTLCILIIDTSNTPDQSLFRYIALGVAILISFEIRTVGFVLLPIYLTCWIFVTYQKRSNIRSWKRCLIYALVPCMVFLGLWYLFSQIFPDESASYTAQLQLNQLPQTIFNNMKFYLTDAISSLFFSRIIFFCLLPFCLIGAIVNFERDHALAISLLIMLVLCAIWPAQQGVRFLYPIFLPLLLFIYQGINYSASRLDQKLGRKVVSVLGFCFLLVFMAAAFYSSLNHAKQNLNNNRLIDGPFSPVSAEMFSFISKEAEPNSVIGFFKPRAMRMMTNRDSFTVTECSKIDAVDYLVVNKTKETYNQIPAELLNDCHLNNVSLVKVHEDSEFSIYRINH